jgi:hypothetical protein
MKKHYDFSRAEQGRLHRPAKSLRIPVYLDDDVHKALVGKEHGRRRNLSRLVNDVLRTQLDIVDRLK